MLGQHGVLVGLRILHLESMKNIRCIFGLAQSETKFGRQNLNAQKIRGSSQILEFKSFVESSDKMRNLRRGIASDDDVINI